MNSIIEKKGSKVSKMSERVVVQLNINANKKEDVYYKDKNKDEIYKVIGEKMSDVLFENFIIVLISLEKYDKLYYNGDRSNKTILVKFFGCDNYVKTYDILGQILTDEERRNVIEEMIKMNSNYVLYTDEERKEIDEMQMEENKKLFFERGIEQGIEQGIENNTNEMITNMLKEKASMNFISRVTNKPVQEIKKIATSLNLI